MRALLVPVMLAMAAIACGPSTNGNGGDDDDTPIDGGGAQPDGYLGPTGSINGQVWAPGNAPGMVPAGHEIPISGALIYVSLSPPPAIPQEVYCDQCQDPPGTNTLSDAKGFFNLAGIRPDTYWLVIQKGQFRLDQMVLVTANETIMLPASNTTLPSVQDPTNGKWIPKIALAEGLWDNVEEIMGKIGIGAVDATGYFVGTSAAGNFDMYENGFGSFGAYALHDLNWLVTQPAEMMNYHIIFVPCSDGDNSQLFTDPEVRTNIRNYVNAGGKFYVTDWSSEWEDVVFPDFIQFVSDHDTAPGGAFNDGDGFPGYESEHALADDADLYAWLDGQMGPVVTTPGSYTNGVINAGDFKVEGAWDHIETLPMQEVLGPENLPVDITAHAWVKGDWGNGEGPIHPLTVSFEPTGCGRVLYSSYHTADNTHVGLVPQERVLLYLIMEIGVCKSGPIID